MTCSIYCPQTRQDCPSPWACTTGCNFNNEVVPKQSAQERAAAAFWAPDLPVQFVGPEPDDVAQKFNPLAWIDFLPNQWDRCNWWQKALTVIAAVILCCLVG